MRKLIPFIVMAVLGCIGQESFMLTDITFCADEPYERTYEHNPDATYVQGEIVWMYLEGFKFQYNEEQKDELTIYSASFEVTLKVYDSDRNIVLEGNQPIDIASAQLLTYAWFKFWIESKDFEEGTYTVQITAVDSLSGESATTEGTFFIVKG